MINIENIIKIHNAKPLENSNKYEINSCNCKKRKMNAF